MRPAGRRATRCGPRPTRWRPRSPRRRRSPCARSARRCAATSPTGSGRRPTASSSEQERLRQTDDFAEGVRAVGRAPAAPVRGPMTVPTGPSGRRRASDGGGGARRAAGVARGAAGTPSSASSSGGPGWPTPAGPARRWPRRWGGRGLPAAMAELVGRRAAPSRRPGPPEGVGMHLAAPTILEHGSDELKQRLIRGRPSPARSPGASSSASPAPDRTWPG